jgi:hypothetical protein
MPVQLSVRVVCVGGGCGWVEHETIVLNMAWGGSSARCWVLRRHLLLWVFFLVLLLAWPSNASAGLPFGGGLVGVVVVVGLGCGCVLSVA